MNDGEANSPAPEQTPPASGQAPPPETTPTPAPVEASPAPDQTAPPPSAEPVPAQAAATAESSPVAEEATPEPVRSRVVRFSALVVGILAGLLGVFYAVENWRGTRAWESSKSLLEAQQEPLDWAAFKAPALPDDQNFFKAAKMQDWFVGVGTNELTARLSLESFAAAARQRGYSNGPATLVELILRTNGFGSANSDATIGATNITFDNIPLGEAVSNLARLANIKVQIDPNVLTAWPGLDGKQGTPPLVAGHWTNVTPSTALLALLCNDNLLWENDTNTGGGLIKLAEAVSPPAAGRDTVLGYLRRSANRLRKGSSGFTLSGNSLAQLGPMRLSVAADSIPTRSQLARLYPVTDGLQVKPAENSLLLVLNSAPVAAEDYLAWSDQFSPEFDQIRTAVKRPAARLDSENQQAGRPQVINYAAVNMVARTLADRATCYLILGQPEPAWLELTLLGDLRRSLECGPSHKPMSLASVTGNLAVTGLYAETVAYGLQLQLWRQPELVSLQEQLGRIELVPLVWSALESERAGACHWLEAAPRSEVMRLLDQNSGASGKISASKRLAVNFMPQGWRYQNMAQTAALDQQAIDALDRLQDVIRPHQVEAAHAAVVAAFDRASPYSFLAKYVVTSSKELLKNTARVQTLASETLVVCALERYRLANGSYPTNLDALTPKIIPVLAVDTINGGALHYRRGATGRFILYSIGWNEKDDHGAPGDATGNGDWVWSGL